MTLNNTSSHQDQTISLGNSFTAMETTPSEAEDIISALVEICEDLDTQIDEKDKLIEDLRTELALARD